MCGVGLGCHRQRVWREGRMPYCIKNTRYISRETALILCLTMWPSIRCWVSRSSMSKVEWPGLNPNWWSEKRSLEKKKDFMSTAMMDSMTLLMIGSNLKVVENNGFWEWMSEGISCEGARNEWGWVTNCLLFLLDKKEDSKGGDGNEGENDKCDKRMRKGI